MTTIIQQIRDEFEIFKKEIEKIIENKIMASKQVRVQNGLSDISERLGLVRAGEFRTGNNKEPGYGFSGVRISYPPVTYENQEWNVAGVNRDRLQFGISADDGSAFFSQGAVQMNERGIISNVYNKLVTFDGTSVEGWLGGASVHGNRLFGVFHIDKSGDTLLDDFEDGTLSNWTTVGEPSIYEESATADGNYSCLIRKNGYITKSLTIPGTTTAVCIKIKARSLSVVGASASLVITLGTTGATGTVVVSSTWQEYVFIGMGSGVTPETLTIRTSNADADIVLVDDIYYDSGATYSFIGSASDGPEVLYVDASSSVAIQKQGATFLRAYVNEVWLHKKNVLVNQGTGNNAYMYFKDSYLIFRYLDGATTRYKYLDLSGTGVTWVHSTTEP